MAERAGLFNDDSDFDVSGFTPKKPPAKDPAPPASTAPPITRATVPPPEAVRQVSEGVFQSREAIDAVPAAVRTIRQQRAKRRTGRNLQLNLKVSARALEMFYKITDANGWVLGETFEFAMAALERELAAKKG